MTDVTQYDPPAANVLDVVADGWARELQRDFGDDVPPHVDEFDVGYQAVDTWHGGNPDPALTVIREALLDAGAITRLRSSAVGALERRRVRWAVQHGRELPKPLSEHRIWEVTDVDRFEETVASLNTYFPPLPAEVRGRIISWATRPETNVGAPERGWLLDDTIDRLRPVVASEKVSTETRARFLRWYNDAYKGMYDDFAEQLWRWLNAEGALRKLTLAERARLGIVPAGTRVWDRDCLAAALPEVTLER